LFCILARNIIINAKEKSEHCQEREENRRYEMGRSRFATGNQASRGLIVSAGWLLGFSRSRTRGLGSWGEGRHAIAEAESLNVHIRNHGRDRRQPSRLECSDGRWASVVGPKPPKGNYRWGPKILGARCGRATCAGPKPGLRESHRHVALKRWIHVSVKITIPLAVRWTVGVGRFRPVSSIISAH